jgi:trehalose-phosphatase
MNAELTQALRRCAEAYHQGSRLALFLDYDGTLSPIVRHPEEALLPTETRALLQRLAEVDRVYVGIVSGRALADLKEKVSLSVVDYSGGTGLEMELDGVRSTHPSVEAGQKLAAEAAERLGEHVCRFSGAWIEQKPLGLTLHFRQTPHTQIPALLADAELVLKSFGDRLRIYEGAMALEIVPNLGCTKRSAICQMLHFCGDGPVIALYAGDDANDAEPLQHVADQGGVAIGVGERAPACAKYRLPDPASLREHLAHLLQQILASAR